MSSRRGSTVATTAGPSRSDSPLSPTAASHDDDGVDGATTKTAASRRHALRTSTGRMDSGESSRGSSVLTNSSYIQRVPQLDIAFLHAVSTHRPLGPHKHFNLIPVLMTLDRTARQVGADIRDGSASEDSTPMPPAEEEAIDAAGQRRSRSISRRISGTAIKREEGDDAESDNRLLPEPPALNAHIDAGMVWQRMEELYDVEGLEDLEYQSMDADEASPLANVPRPTFVSLASRKELGKSLAEVPVVFGFGSSLLKVADDSAKAISGVGSAASRKKSKAAAAKAAAAADEDDELQHAVEFELGPWDEFEVLIAPRRLKSFAPDDADDASESDGELSDLEDEAEDNYAMTKSNEEDSIEVIDEEDVEDGDQGEEEGDEDDEEDDDGGEGEARSTGKRKGGAGNTKATPAAQRQKRGSGTGTSPAASGKRASRSSAAAAQPRRSTRR